MEWSLQSVPTLLEALVDQDKSLRINILCALKGATAGVSPKIIYAQHIEKQTERIMKFLK